MKRIKYLGPLRDTEGASRGSIVQIKFLGVAITHSHSRSTTKSSHIPGSFPVPVMNFPSLLLRIEAHDQVPGEPHDLWFVVARDWLQDSVPTTLPVLNQL